MFFGNLFVYFQFQGKTHIDEDTRQIIFTVLISVAIIGVIFLATLRHTVRPMEVVSANDYVDEKSEEVRTAAAATDDNDESMLGAFRNAIALFCTTEMLMLSVTFLYTGLELSFFSGVYSSSIGFTLAIGESAKQLVGLSGICIGIGEVSGGILFGLLGAKTANHRFGGRDMIVMLGFVLHALSFVLIYLNLPNVSPFGDTKEVSVLDPPLPSVALLCSLLLGFGDACFNTQIYSMLGGVFAQKSAAAFALFKFTQVIFGNGVGKYFYCIFIF